jgi:hypothetical protein
LFFEQLEDRWLLTAEFEPNNALASATAFGIPSDTLTGRIDNVNDIDYFSRSLSSGDTLRFRFSDNDDDGSPAFGPSMEIVNSTGEVKAASLDTHTFAYTVQTAGTYALRLTASNAFGNFTDAYSISATVDAFSGTVESESNNSVATANTLSGETNFRGSLAGTGDVDYFSFVGVAGQAVIVKLAEKLAANPAVRLFAPGGALVATDRTGLGLQTVLTQTGTYAFSLQSDNSAGTVTGSYVGQMLLATKPNVDGETGNGFEAATLLDLGPHVVPSLYLSPTAAFSAHGLTGSYINQNLRGSTQTNWTATQIIAGTRVDPLIHFPQDDWGNRASLGLTNGSNDNWDDFSVQWDGFVRIVTADTQIYTASDDGSRMWIDLNGDGVFNSSGSEFVNNNWGNGQGNTLGPASVSLAAGDYRIRIQYEEGGGGNNAYLLWSDAVHSAGAVSRNNHQDGVGSLSSLSDVDVYSVNLTGTGFYEFRLESTAGAIATQNRLLTLYNEFGQPLESSTSGRIATDRHHTRPETTSRYFVTVQATNETGLGAYLLVARIDREFPNYRDIPLFYQDYSGYSKPSQVPEFLAFFESRYDVYQIDLTQSNPGSGSEHVDWRFISDNKGCGGAAGGGYGNRRVSGGGAGDCSADWRSLADVWFGLFYHENGHGVGLPHTRHPLAVMSYGGQYDYFPVGSYNRIGGDARTSVPKVQNERNYLDWAFEAGRIVLEDESNDDLASAQRLNPFFGDMTTDADPRNDQVVVVGAVATPTDTDVFRFTAAANETYAIDIDAAEFQYPLDAKLEILNGSGTVLATNQGAIDRDTGLASVDPYLVYQFATAGDYYVRVRSELNTIGNYRLKVTPQRAFDQTGPRIAASWPDGGASVDGTRQLIFWTNDQLDPATLTATNIVVTGQSSGIRAGSAVFDPITSTLTWRANSVLPPDTYTITLRGGAGGITDLRGNRLDGETDGVLNWPEVSGNGAAGGDFNTSFTITQADATPATVDWAAYSRHQHDRGMFEIGFSDELDVLDVYSKTFTLRGAGPDHAFNTTDDTYSPVDVIYDRISNTSDHLLRVYTRGVPDPDSYRIEVNLLDAVGNNVTLSQPFDVTATVPASALFTTPAKTTGGLLGTYINQSLRGYAPQDDWRTTQSVAGTRNDPVVGFYNDSFGLRSQVGVTGGSDANWDNFSAQWDGVVVIPANGVRLSTRSDDGSRMWIDINGDGVFNSSGSELVNNNWGNGQVTNTSPASVPLNAGTYRVRLQYEEGDGGNQMQLMWDYAGAFSTVDGLKSNPQVVDVSVQPNTVLTTPPTSIDVMFSQSIATASLTTSSFRVRYSPDPTFFDANDAYLTESDGAIAWSPTLRKATFQPAATLVSGYYLIELDGDPGGITSLSGRLLDGEYRDTNIAGNTSQYGWNDSPSGDGLPGGDYRAMFIVSLPTVTLSVAPTSLAEATGTATVTATLSTTSTQNVTVNLAFSGTATNVTDYNRSGTQIVIAAGSTTGTVTLTAVQDALYENYETIVVDIVSVTNGTESGTQQVIATIIDDDLPPTVTLSVVPASIAEAGGTATVTATLSAVSGLDVTVNLGFTGTATNVTDYTRSATQIVIPAGSTTGKVTLTAVQDSLDETNETIVVDISGVTNGTESGTQQVMATIVDDDRMLSLTVTNTNDSGLGSLRQAILDANASNNASLGQDRIQFSIGSGAKTIDLATGLPTITDPVIIDGTTQPGFVGTPLIELNGAGAGADVDALVISASDSVVRGFVINRFSGFGVVLTGAAATRNVIAGNYIGTNTAGTAVLGNAKTGVWIKDGAHNNLVGSDGNGLNDALEANVVAGNGFDGITIEGVGSDANVIAGNFIGTNATGTVALGGNHFGVLIKGGAKRNLVGTDGDGIGDSAERNVISGNLWDGAFIGDPGTDSNVVAGNYIGVDVNGATALANSNGVRIDNGAKSNLIGTNVNGVADLAERNVISGNRNDGVLIIAAGTSNNTVAGNYIGVDATGLVPVGNSLSGVAIIDASNNLIGGNQSGAGNVLSNNGFDGVAILSGTGNGVLRNSISANGRLGIELKPDDVTLNDVGDGDTGPNNLQNFPVLSAASRSATNTQIQGTINSIANSQYQLDFFASDVADASGYGEGKQFLGTTTVTTNGSGNASFNLTLPVSVPVGSMLTATATDGSNNTSEFSQAILAPNNPSIPSVTLSVTPASIVEAAGTAIVTATLSAVSSLDVTVALGFTGTATNVTDYTRSATQIVIAAGSTTGTVTLTAVQDTLDETNETIVVDISGVTNGTESGTQQVIATIIDGDLPPSVTLSVAPASIAEAGGTSTVTATLSTASSFNVTVDLAFTGTATSIADYTRSATQIVIAAGNTTGTVTLTAVQDTLVEGNETVIVDIIGVTNGTELGTQQQTITIADEATPSSTLQVSSFMATSSGFVVQFNRDLNASPLNVYDTEMGALGTADVVLQGATVGIVRGSVVVDPGLRKISFLKTGGPLETAALLALDEVHL